MNRRATIFLLLSATLPSTAAAQRVERFELRWDNDFLAPRTNGKPDDRDYTHGLELSAELVRDSADAHAPRHRIAAGQRIYTPRIDGDQPVAGERPYAGWLYAAAERRTGGPRAEYTLGVEVGVTGPAALGEPVQNGVHRLTGSRRQRGWAHQLSFEPAFVVRARAGVVRRMGGVEVRPYGEVGIGTLWDGIAAGVRATAGGERGFHAGAAVRGAWVARDLFVDGNTFATGVHASRRPLVGTAEAAVGHRWRHASLEYRVTARGREYAAQRSPHVAGSISLGWRR